jgi:hypothetical protein
VCDRVTTAHRSTPQFAHGRRLRRRHGRGGAGGVRAVELVADRAQLPLLEAPTTATKPTIIDATTGEGITVELFLAGVATDVAKLSKN